MTTQQEVFNLVYAGLRNQGFRSSLNVTHRCSYRGQDGMKCAIGHILDDDFYDPKIEGCGVKFVLDLLPVVDNAYAFYDGLQVAHDDAESEDDMAYRLMKFATKFGLEVPAL